MTFTDAEDKVKKSYQKLLTEFGIAPKSLGWDKGKQYLRFHELTELWDLNNSSILDIGCGFGDFVNFINFEKIKPSNYEGIDLVDQFIDIAASLHTQRYVDFRVGTFLEYKFTKTFDYCIASGTFNLKMDDVDEYSYIELNLKKMYDICEVGIAVNFLTDKVDHKHSHNFNSSPERILTMAYSLSRRVLLRNDTFPFEFSIIIFKDDSFKVKDTTFTIASEKLTRYVN
jgi:SAM-dependent methyltransferase